MFRLLLHSIVIAAVAVFVTPLSYSQSGKVSESLQYTIPPFRTESDSIVGVTSLTPTSTEFVEVDIHGESTVVPCGKVCVEKLMLSVGLSCDGASLQHKLGVWDPSVFDGEIEIVVDVELSGTPPLAAVIVNDIGLTVQFLNGVATASQAVLHDIVAHSKSWCDGSGYSPYTKVRIKIKSIDHSTATQLLKDNVKLYARLEEFTKSHPSTVTTVGCNNNVSMILPHIPTATLASNPVTLKWNAKATNACPDDLPFHEVQVLRLHNTNEAHRTAEHKVTATVDWSQAQRFIVYGRSPENTINSANGTEGSLTFTLADGTGYYLWRVRPIGNWHDGDLANEPFGNTIGEQQWS